MNDSSPSEPPGEPDEKRERSRRERIEAVVRWAEYIQENPPEVWGPQQNRLVNAQLESARETGLPAEHFRRIRRFGETAGGTDATSDLVDEEDGDPTDGVSDTEGN